MHCKFSGHLALPGGLQQAQAAVQAHNSMQFNSMQSSPGKLASDKPAVKHKSVALSLWLTIVRWVWLHEGPTRSH
jgi:hypothetical protein